MTKYASFISPALLLLVGVTGLWVLFLEGRADAIAALWVSVGYVGLVVLAGLAFRSPKSWRIGFAVLRILFGLIALVWMLMEMKGVYAALISVLVGVSAGYLVSASKGAGSDCLSMAYAGEADA